MRGNTRFKRYGALLLGLLALPACAGMGTLGEVLAGVPGVGSTVSGEVRRVDARRQEIHLRTRHGSTERVAYDRNTRVFYRRDRYPVGALETGDEVSVRLQQDRRGRLYADRIEVERSANRRDSRYPDRDRDYPRAREARLEGRVERVDHRRGEFRVRDPQRRTFVVTLPYRPDDRTADRFHRLRKGDFVRVQAVILDGRRVELQRFY